MMNQLLQLELSAEQKAQVYGILSVGCDRETAANFVGCSPAEIARAMRHDKGFAATVRRTEAAAELSHMRTVHKAAKDEKNWRASVWWLERRSPERFGSRGAGTVTARHLKAFLTILGEGLNSDIHDPTDRERVMSRFKEYQTLIDDLNDSAWQATPTAEDCDMPLNSVLENGIGSAANSTLDFNQ
jgi:hypothetical protein